MPLLVLIFRESTSHVLHAAAVLINLYANDNSYIKCTAITIYI